MRNFLHVKKPQWITICIALVLVALLFFYGRTIPHRKTILPQTNVDKEEISAITADTILLYAKKQLSPERVMRINALENSISRGDIKEQQLMIYHQLAHFWAEASRLENSEKSLTFAARLFLDNLQNDELVERRKWKALQAKNLFERSLKINPGNDSAKVGLGACYLFGNISSTPMEGILKIREVVEKDSTNIYAQMMLARGSLISGQYDKAISRLQVVNRLETDNAEAIIMLADLYERTGDIANAVTWYQKSLPFIKQPDARTAIEKRIAELKK